MNRKFSKALNAQQTIYGLKIFGLFFAVVGAMLSALKLGIIWFTVGAVPGYAIGVMISDYVHQGSLQKWLYWNTPILNFCSRNRLPPSFQRWFF